MEYLNFFSRTLWRNELFFCVCSRFLPQSKDLHASWTGDAKLPLGVTVFESLH